MKFLVTFVLLATSYTTPVNSAQGEQSCHLNLSRANAEILACNVTNLHKYFDGLRKSVVYEEVVGGDVSYNEKQFLQHSEELCGWLANRTVSYDLLVNQFPYMVQNFKTIFTKPEGNRKVGCMLLAKNYIQAVEKFWITTSGVPNRKMQNGTIAKSIVSICKTTYTNCTDISAEDRWYVNRGDFWQTYIKAILLDDIRNGNFGESLWKKQLLADEPPSERFDAISRTLQAKIDMVLGEIRGHGASMTMVSGLSSFITDNEHVAALYNKVNEGCHPDSPKVGSFIKGFLFTAGRFCLESEIAEALEDIHKKYLENVLAAA